MSHVSRKGFTLIEMIVVVGVVALTIPAVFAITFAVLRQQAKLYALKTVKREGDLALNAIKTNIKNCAVTIHDASPPLDTNAICDQTGSNNAPTTMYFVDKTGAYFSYSNSSTKIASNSSIPNAAGDLTTPNVQVDNLTFSCVRTNQFSPPVVSVKFQIQYQNPDRHADISSMTYQTQIRLRTN